MKKVLITLSFLLFLSIQAMLAQSRTINGTVTDADDGNPIPGATVIIKGTTVGTATNVNGQFSFSVPQNAETLVVTFIGMKKNEVVIGNRSTINIVMESDAVAMDEILVIAYGTTTKKSFTGSAATIKGDNLTKLQSSSVSKSLEGTVAGVQVASSSGQPGVDAAIRIRGLGSISASQSPLIVVDGVPYEGSLNSISSQDIETLSVLKDAAANSMYGARGSNGVILITTKRGESGETKISFDSRFGVNSRGVPAYDVVTNNGDYYELYWEAARNNLVEGSGMSVYDANNYASNNLISEYLGYNSFSGVADNQLIDPATGRLNPSAKNRKWSDNWLSDPFQNGVRQEYNINVKGGTENTSAYMSLGYLDDMGYIKNSGFNRISARAKVDQKLGENIKIGSNISYAKTSSGTPVAIDGGTNYSNMFMFTQLTAPIYPIYAYDIGTGDPILDAKGNKTYDFGSGLISNGAPSINTRTWAPQQNPVYTLSQNITETNYDNLSARGYAEIKFLKDFKFTFNIAYDVFSSNYTDFATPLAGDAEGYGYGYKENTRYAALNLNQLLNYTKEFGLNNINVLIGHETKADNYIYLLGGKKNYYDPYNPEFINAGSTTQLTSYVNNYRIEGYLSRVEYDYANKYFASASFRHDGSSKFAPAVRWGNFWSVGGAWRIKDESFLEYVDAISNLKLKASYGTQGNDNIPGSNLYMDQFTMVSDGTYVSPVFSFRGAPNLTWEKSNNFNAGIELGLFDRINLNVEYFIKETNDMIYQKPFPPSKGSPTWQWDNQIDMKNNGIEVELTVNAIKTNDVKWDLALNATTYKNQLTRLPLDKDPEGYQAGNYWRQIGGSLYDWYLYEWAGVEPETGLAMWYMNDEDDKKVTTTNYAEADLYEAGKSALPDFYGGFSSNLTAYGFDFSFQTAFQLGGYVYDNIYSFLMSAGGEGQNWHKDIYKRWTETNTNTDVPRVSIGDQNAAATSTRFLTSSSYFSLRNITLGYTLPKKLTKKFDIESLRLYVVGDNLWFLSARKGLDPRQTFSGVTYVGNYSALRTTSIGLSVSF